MCFFSHSCRRFADAAGSGFTRSAYDDIPNFKGPTFDWHKDRDHMCWVYVYLYVYLKRKDKQGLSGAEEYVWGEILEGGLEWIPSRASAAIQAEMGRLRPHTGRSDGDDDAPGAGGSGGDMPRGPAAPPGEPSTSRDMEKMRADISSLKRQMRAVGERLVEDDNDDEGWQ